MNILNITEKDLPVYNVKQYVNGGWYYINSSPFATLQLAEKWIAEYNSDKTTMIEQYDKELWREDLIKRIIQDETSMRAALSWFSNEFFVGILKGP